MIWFSNPPLWGEGRVGVQEACVKHKTPFFDLLTAVKTPCKAASNKFFTQKKNHKHNLFQERLLGKFLFRLCLWLLKDRLEDKLEDRFEGSLAVPHNCFISLCAFFRFRLNKSYASAKI